MKNTIQNQHLGKNKMKELLILFLTAFIPLSGYAAHPISTHYDFKTMIGLGSHSINSARKKLGKKDLKEVDDFSKAYQAKIKLVTESPGLHSRIPEVIHFIWLGPKDFPKESIKNVESWREYHPTWTIKFWTDRADRPCPIKEMEKVLVSDYDFKDMTKFISETSNYGEKSDLMRYVILYNEGGIYADHDAKCIKSFTRFVNAFDLVACFERPHYHKSIDSSLTPANGLICIKPHHPALRETMKEVTRRWKVIGKKYPGKNYSDNFNRVIQRTFDSFAKSVKPFGLDIHTRDIILPTCFFYPDRTLSTWFTKALRKTGLVYSTHQYAGSWK